MKKLLLFFVCIFGCIVSANADNQLEYEIEGNGNGVQGTYLVKVSLLSKKNNPNSSELARCAVHGVLFRGFSNPEQHQTQKPLAGSAAVEAQHADYFNQFFADGGAFQKYVAEVSGSRHVVKVGKQYRVTATVTVNKDLLRKDLEDAGVLKGLNSIF
jgi:hypothetical protein